MNNYAVVITMRERKGAVSTLHKLTLDVIALCSTDAGLHAIRSVGPQGNFSVTVKAMGVRS